MTELEKTNIRILREAGYSYGSISELLGVNKWTVRRFCLSRDIAIAPENLLKHPLKLTRYNLCPYCRTLFMQTSKHERQFCSDKCRFDNWRREEAERVRMAEEYEQHMTLKKELDFLARKSDELDGSKLKLCYRHESSLM